MAVFDFLGDLKGNMVDCWFPNYLDPRWRTLSVAQQNAIIRYIEDVFDLAAKTPPHRFNVTNSVPSDWRNTALQPLYEIAAVHDAKDAAKLLGNLFCRIGIKRSDLWDCFQQNVGDHTSRTYVLHR